MKKTDVKRFLTITSVLMTIPFASFGNSSISDHTECSTELVASRAEAEDNVFGFRRSGIELDCDSDLDIVDRNKCDCLGFQNIYVGQAVERPDKTILKLNETYLSVLEKNNPVGQFAFRGNDGIKFHLLTSSASCLNFNVDVYIDDVFYDNHHYGRSALNKFKVPAQEGIYSLVFNQPVYEESRSCSIYVRADASNSYYPPNHKSVVGSLISKNILRDIKIESLVIYEAGLNDHAGSGLAAINDACGRLEEHHKHNNASSILSAETTYSNSTPQRTAQWIEGVSAAKYQFNEWGSEQRVLSEGAITISWFLDKLHHYYKESNAQSIDLLWSLCGNWQEKKGFAEYLREAGDNVVVKYSPRELGDSRALDISFFNAMTDVFDILLTNVSVENTGKDGCYSDPVTVSKNGDMIFGGSFCQNSASSYHAEYSNTSAIEYKFIKATGKELSLIENSLQDILGPDISLEWKVNLDRFKRVSATGFKGKIVPNENKWEMLDLTFMSEKYDDGLAITVVADGYVAPATLNPPTGKYPKAMSDTNPGVLAAFINKLLLALGLESPTHSVLSD